MPISRPYLSVRLYLLLLAWVSPFLIDMVSAASLPVQPSRPSSPLPPAAPRTGPGASPLCPRWPPCPSIPCSLSSAGTGVGPAPTPVSHLTQLFRHREHPTTAFPGPLLVCVSLRCPAAAPLPRLLSRSSRCRVSRRPFLIPRPWRGITIRSTPIYHLHIPPHSTLRLRSASLL